PWRQKVPWRTSKTCCHSRAVSPTSTPKTKKSGPRPSAAASRTGKTSTGAPRAASRTSRSGRNMPLPSSGQDDSLPFTGFERRADGCLVVLLLALFLAGGAILWWPGSAWRNAALLLGGAGAGVLGGLAVGRRIGRHYVGGMFLRWWLRLLYLLLV